LSTRRKADLPRCRVDHVPEGNENEAAAHIASEAYRTLWADMIRLKAEDFEQRRALAAAGSLSEDAFVTRFGYLGPTPVLSTFR
jgi:hypothetical protein